MKTAMQQLLEQMREERSKLPMPIEWDRAYQAIEMMIETSYIPLEKKQIMEAAERWKGTDFAERYYSETYEGEISEDAERSICPKCTSYDWNYWYSLDKMKCSDCGYAE